MTNTKKTSKKVCFTTLAQILDAAESTGITLEDVTYADLHEFIDNELTLLANKAEAAKARAAAKKVEGDELRERIFNVLNTKEFMTTIDILDALNIENLTANAVVNRLKYFVDNGRVEKDMVPAPSVDGKARKITGYRVVA